MKVEKIKALQCIQNERVFYLASISSQVLKIAALLHDEKKIKIQDFKEH